MLLRWEILAWRIRPAYLLPVLAFSGYNSMNTNKKRQKTVVISLSVLVAILFTFSIIQQAFNLTPYLGTPERQTTLLLWALTSLNVILLVICGLILLRNLLKLYFERRSRQLGSKFQTKLVFSFLGL